MTATTITEENELHRQWYVDAKKQTLGTLPDFIDRVLNGCKHDYGTICHAIAACMVAMMSACDKSPQGGITGFQGGAIMWEVLRHAFYIDGPARLQRMEDLLYPQNEYKFRTISEETVKYIQAEAKRKLADIGEHAHPDVVGHWRRVADGGWIPFGLEVAE